MSSSAESRGGVGTTDAADRGAAGARVRASVLGPVLVEARGSRGLIETPGILARRLLVALVLADGRSVSVSALVDDVWGDAPPRGARAALQTLISRLRQICSDDLIASTASGYVLSGLSDIARADDLLESGSRRAEGGEPVGAVAEFSEALSLWRGDPGADLGESDTGDALRARTSILRRQLLRRRAECLLESAEPAAALDDIAALGFEGDDDDLVALRMKALASAGRRTEAVRAFADYRERLADELGTDPSPALVAQHTELLREAPRPTSSPGHVTVGLRTAPNALIGRDDDLREVLDLLDECRLVTILGAGGLGKTRLAQEVGRRSSETTPVVLVVELASVRSDEDIALALASVLGIRDFTIPPFGLADPGLRRDLRERILTALAERETLLVVDNCEHLVEAAATWVADILASTSAVRILATSRAPLAIGAERVYSLDSLSGDEGSGGEGAAITLFRERARAARPGVSFDTATAQRLCARLDGLPLAIELAAARVRSLSVDEIERRLGNRFALLTSGDRSSAPRHRTLVAVIEWSWNLLAESEQALLRRLSRFPDGFDAEAAQTVGSLGRSLSDPGADDVTDDLDGLVTQSLVAVNEDPATGRARYRMLETVREFGALALQNAGEHEAVRDAMFLWGERVASALGRLIDSTDQVRVFALLTSEQDNLVALLRAAIEHRRGREAMALFSTLGYFWTLRGSHSDVASFGASMLRATRGHAPDSADRDQALLAYTLISATILFNDRRSGLVSLGRLRSLARKGPADDPVVDLLSTLVLRVFADPESLEQVLAAAQRSADRRVRVLAFLLSSQARENAGALDLATERAEEAYGQAAEAGFVWAGATAATQLASLVGQQGRPEEVFVWTSRARGGLTAIRATLDVRHLDWLEALAALALGRIEEARVAFEGILSDDASTQGDDFEEFRAMGRAGLAEVEIASGEVVAGLARYRRTVSTLGRNAGPFSEWYILVGPACLTAHAVAASALGEAGFDVLSELNRLANRLRTRLVASMRLPGLNLDVPMIGAQLLGTAAWVLRPGRETSGRLLDVATELFFLSEVLGGRQDLPSLRRLPVADLIAARVDPTTVERLRAEVGGIDIAEARIRARRLLSDPALREPPR